MKLVVLQIPFEKPVPAGFHDPSEDKYEKDTTFKKQTRAEIEGPRRDDVENEERKKDRERLKKRRYVFAVFFSMRIDLVEYEVQENGGAVSEHSTLYD